MKFLNFVLKYFPVYFISVFYVNAQSQQTLLNEPIDLSKDFRDYTNTYFLADSMVSFDPITATGEIRWKRSEYFPAHAFNFTQHGIRSTVQNEFPSREYAQDPVWPFQLEFVSSRAVRLKMATGIQSTDYVDTLMIPGGRVTSDPNWKYSKILNGHEYRSNAAIIRIYQKPWKIEVLDIHGRSLTKTVHTSDNKGFCANMPFCYVRRAHDYSRSVGAVFSLMPDEKIFGCGESFTKMNKYGQKINLYTCDPNGVETTSMYKPIPFYMSSRGYGVFVHSSTPMTMDFGNSYGATNALWLGDESLDMFLFVGSPKEILNEYTNITGKASVPPLWSFGLWMSRISYFTQKDGMDVATKLRANRIPTDVLHFDTGWFETDWRCDYEFSPSRFPDPQGMIDSLNKNGFKTCLWQLPYFVPKNKLFPEIVQNSLHVKNANGNIPFEDAVLDFTNPATIAWYKNKLSKLLNMGVAAIKVDFGEAAPYDGIYANKRTGMYEHNLYPLRYNQVVSDLTNQLHGERIIWARSGWAGSQRYPIHWGGDAETSYMGMEAQLRGGLSLGLSGFTFWSHDIGGFTKRTPEALYRRWLPFGMMSSHSRCHGQPPKEPWDYGEDFQSYFRKVVELKYKLMPYVYSQSVLAAHQGLPMTRALFVEYPNDRGAWDIENEYLFGSDILVAPLFEEGILERDVYLPGGNWIDFQTGKNYPPGWQKIKANDLEAIILIRDGAALPTVKLAQSTRDIDWSGIEMVPYSSSGEAKSIIIDPFNGQQSEITLSKTKNGYSVKSGNQNFNARFSTRTIF